MRFLFYSHDGLGLGHTRRHLAVATALAEQAPQSAILLATGAEEAGRQGLPRQVEILKLPGLRKDANEKYSARRLQVSMEEIRGLRSAILLSAVRAFEPQVVLVDKHPFGASGEFRDGLKALRRNGGRAALGLRDILDDPRQVQLEWHKVQPRIPDFYDRVLVYGDQAIYDPIRAYSFAPALARKTTFCGYVLSKVRPAPSGFVELPMLLPEQRTQPVVLATAGGGEDGYQLLSTFIQSAAGAPWHGVVIAGPMTPDAELGNLEALAAQNGVTFRHYIPNLSALFDSVDALVCMGGYNTLVEAAALGVPTVCVPRIKPRTEQLMRAEAFERLGLLDLCHPEELHRETLRRKIDRTLKQPGESWQRRPGGLLNFNGAQRAAEQLLLLGRSPREPQPAGNALSAALPMSSLNGHAT